MDAGSSNGTIPGRSYHDEPDGTPPGRAMSDSPQL